MIEVLVIILGLSLFAGMIMRNFFIQLVALKLFLDTLVFSLVMLRGANQASTAHQASAWLLASFGTIVFFVLMAVSVRRFATIKRVEGRNHVE